MTLTNIIGYVQWCSRKYLGTGAVQNISSVLFLEREHKNTITYCEYMSENIWYIQDYSIITH